MTPFYFGATERRLFAAFHPGERPDAPRGGVVLVPPFGHEAIRTHRFYRVLADRLARQGHDVLRFDPYGSGDSAGDDAELRLAGWADDVVSAHQELGARSGAAPTLWVGARLGATAALIARARLAGDGMARPGPALALWDPVVEGGAYLDELRRRHVEALEASFSLADPQWRQRLADPESYAGEAIGFAIAPEFRREILSVRPETLVPTAGQRVQLVCSPGAGSAIAWSESCSLGTPARLLERDFEWTSDDSLNTALVPADALTALLRTCDELRS
jgi:uncharacterized protein